MNLLRALHEISSDAQTTTDEKLERLLRLGLDALGMDIGLVSRITENDYTVIAAVTPDNSIEKHTVFPLADTFCKDTLQANSIVAYHNVPEHPGITHPAYQSFSLRSYIGIPYFVNGVRQGTVNFSKPDAREWAFEPHEQDYIVLLAEWVGSELSRQEQVNKLLEQQHQMQHQNRLHKQMAELARVGTWEVDLETGNVWLSDSLRFRYEVPEGYPLTMETTKNFVLHEKDQQTIGRMFRESIETKEPWSYEFEAVSLTGKRFWVQTRAKVDEQADGGKRFFGATQDVTHRVLAAKEMEHRRQIAEQALQSRSLFLANMSHEIRTPINGVLGMLDALSKTPLSAKQKEYCQLASQSADNLLQIINDVLDFSKIDAGELVLESLPLNISKVVHEQQRVFAMTAQKKQLRLTVDTKATDGLQLLGDPTRIRQILTNLLSNAIKFSYEGEVSVKTRAIKQTDSQYLVQIEVKDTGVGIAPEHQSAIFSPFQQGDSNTTRRFGGTGLGLSIVSQIAEQMHGGIRVKSQLGEGSTFIVALSLPISNHSLEADEPTELPVPVHHSRLEKKRVLVVEDNEINQIVVTEQLRAFSITPEIAAHGAESVEMVVQSLSSGHPYDLILMDCQMPIMDGYQASKKIRELGETAQVIPIIALTANVLVGEREKCILAGMNDYLTKPVDSVQFGRCINRYLLA
ncbi:ATP-binding protein [Alteromonas sp. C1M14]|uniref:GAF domain-containing hybrid sensor histidine kinase/response regulator n=1 Tax=Alteromonas sp. C1M14 TaxID=2841567 RepID=UPI001C09AD01|nr:ATP-binding protein [Alteromonas sp. C1M14]MBU2977252.1 response regulator [Alteromonas sp. C1M14]